MQSWLSLTNNRIFSKSVFQLLRFCISVFRLTGSVSSVFLCSAVLTEHMRKEQEKTSEILMEFNQLKVNVETILKISKYATTTTVDILYNSGMQS